MLHLCLSGEADLDIIFIEHRLHNGIRRPTVPRWVAAYLNLDSDHGTLANVRAAPFLGADPEGLSDLEISVLHDVFLGHS